MTQPTSLPFLKAFAFARATTLVAVVVIYQTSDLASKAVREGTKIFLSASFVAAIVGLWARYSPRRWSLWRFGVIYFVGLFILGVLSRVGSG